MVDHRRSSCVKGFKTAGQLPDVQVGRHEDVACHVAAGHVVEEGVVVEAAFELGLPEVVVCIDESWGDDFAVAVDGSGGSWWIDVRFDLSDGIAFDEEVGVLEGGYGVVGVVEQEGTALKEYGSGRHHGGQTCKHREEDVKYGRKI